MAPYSDDCMGKMISWHYKSLDLSANYTLFTREIYTPANPGSFTNSFVPKQSGSPLPTLSITVSLGPAISDLVEFGSIHEVRGTLVEMRTGFGRARGAIWSDGDVSYVIEARGGDQSTEATDAFLIASVETMLQSP